MQETLENPYVLTFQPPLAHAEVPTLLSRIVESTRCRASSVTTTVTEIEPPEGLIVLQDLGEIVIAVTRAITLERDNCRITATFSSRECSASSYFDTLTFGQPQYSPYGLLRFGLARFYTDVRQAIQSYEMSRHAS